MSAARRLITRGDFDGIVCAALLRHRGVIDRVEFAHPKDMQDGLVAVDDSVVTANLPWVPGVHQAFDHHSSEIERTGTAAGEGYVNVPDAPSAARVIYDHYGGVEGFPGVDQAVLEAVDRADSAAFSREEVLDPTGWALINFVLDARTGLGRFRDFRIDNSELLRRMVDEVLVRPAEELLLDHDVSERVRVYFEHEAYFRRQLEHCTRLERDVAIVDLRDQDPIYAGNRFMVYALFPQARISVHCLRGAQGNSVFAIGKSILDRSSPVDVGSVCLAHGGGGHRGAGTCQVPSDRADATLTALIDALATD